MPETPHDYGAANKFGFNDPNRWFTVPSVPLLDEHELTNDAGRPIATVDRAALEEIARNNNRKVYETGDPATLILGHTSDDPRALEKPAVGFVTNFRVKPFKRDANGRTVYALHGDYKLRNDKKHLVEEYPRRSVELWWSRKDVDPVAMLGGSSPERDLGAVIRQGRLNHIALDQTPVDPKTRKPLARTDGDVIRFHRRGNWTIETYGIEDAPVRYGKYTPTREESMAMIVRKDLTPEQHAAAMRNHVAAGYHEKQPMPPMSPKSGKNGYESGKIGGKSPTPTKGPNKYGADDMEDGCGPGKTRYGADDMGDGGEDEYDGGDDAVPTGTEDIGGDDHDGDHGTTDNFEDDGGNESMSPAVAELLQSKPFRQMQSQLETITQFIQSLGGGAGGPPGGDMGAEPMPGGPDGGAGGEEMPPPGGPGAGAAPPMGGPPPGGPDEEESRRGMGERPVQMDAGPTGLPGQGDVYQPGFNDAPGKTRRRMSRPTNSKGTPMTATERKLQEKVIRLERAERDNRLRYAKSEADRRVDALVAEGYLFGQTPAEHAEGIEETKKHLMNLIVSAPNDTEGSADVDYEEDIIRKRYSRKRPDPSRQAGAVGNLARYGRNPTHGKGKPAGPDADVEFEPETDEESCEYAELVGARKMSRAEAGKVMLKRRAIR